MPRSSTAKAAYFKASDAKAKLLTEKVVTILIEENNKDNDENPQSSNYEGDNEKLRTINLEESGLQLSKKIHN